VVLQFVCKIYLHRWSCSSFSSDQAIDSLGLDISNLRVQSYDNASNMSGIYAGLQARIWKLNPLALYVACAAHSLNLVGSCAALQLFGCHVILRVATVAVRFLLCVYLPLAVADVDGCLASAWLGCQIFVRYSLERQSGRNKIGVCSLSRNLESCNRHMRWHKTES